MKTISNALLPVALTAGLSAAAMAQAAPLLSVGGSGDASLGFGGLSGDPAGAAFQFTLTGDALGVTVSTAFSCFSSCLADFYLFADDLGAGASIASLIDVQSVSPTAPAMVTLNGGDLGAGLYSVVMVYRGASGFAVWDASSAGVTGGSGLAVDGDDFTIAALDAGTPNRSGFASFAGDIHYTVNGTAVISPVPLPASLPLMVAGLALIRRRAR